MFGLHPLLFQPVEKLVTSIYVWRGYEESWLGDLDYSCACICMRGGGRPWQCFCVNMCVFERVSVTYIYVV